MWFRAAIARGVLRGVVVLLAVSLAGPMACADDYFEIAAFARHAGSPDAAGAALDAIEIADAACGGCSCAICVPMLLQSASPAGVVPDEHPYGKPAAAPVFDSSYRPEIFRPPSA